MVPRLVENLSTSHGRGYDPLAHVCSSPGWLWQEPCCFALAFSHWQSNDPVKFVCYLIAALLASSLKVTLPGLDATLSVNFLFTLLGILELGMPETLLIVLASTVGQANTCSGCACTRWSLRKNWA